MLRNLYAAAAVIASVAAQEEAMPEPTYPYIATLNTAVDYDRYQKQIVTYTVHDNDFTIDIWWQRLDTFDANPETVKDMQKSGDDELVLIQAFLLTSDLSLEGTSPANLEAGSLAAGEWMESVFAGWAVAYKQIVLVTDESGSVQDGQEEPTHWTIKETSKCAKRECHFSFERKMDAAPELKYGSEILIASLAADSRELENPENVLMGDFQRIPIMEGSGACAGLAAAATALAAFLMF